jgi:hypothetical protein
MDLQVAGKLALPDRLTQIDGRGRGRGADRGASTGANGSASQGSAYDCADDSAAGRANPGARKAAITRRGAAAREADGRESDDWNCNARVHLSIPSK